MYLKSKRDAAATESDNDVVSGAAHTRIDSEKPFYLDKIYDFILVFSV
jgi:hypothetical protein